MMSMLTQIFVRRYVHRHALLIVFLSSAIWGVLWVPMRYAESFGISGLWVVTLFHVLPAIAILPFIARAYIADRQHWLVSFIAGGHGLGFGLGGDPALSKCRFSAYHVYAIFCWRAVGWHGGLCDGRCVSGKASLDCGLASCVFGVDGGVFALGIIDFSDHAICITGAGWHFDVVRGAGCGIVILVVFARGLNPVAMGRRAGDFGNRGVCRSDR